MGTAKRADLSIYPVACSSICQSICPSVYLSTRPSVSLVTVRYLGKEIENREGIGGETRWDRVEGEGMGGGGGRGGGEGEEGGGR